MNKFKKTRSTLLAGALAAGAVLPGFAAAAKVYDTWEDSCEDVIAQTDHSTSFPPANRGTEGGFCCQAKNI